MAIIDRAMCKTIFLITLNIFECCLNLAPALQDVFGTASKLHDPKKVGCAPPKSKCLTIAEAIKLHDFLRERQRSSMLSCSSLASTKMSSKKPKWARRQGEEESRAKRMEDNSTDKISKFSDLNYLVELAFSSYNSDAASKRTDQFSDLLLTKPYQFSYFDKYT